MARAGKRWIVLGIMLWTSLSANVARSDLMFNVSLDTTPLIGHPAGPFSLDFQLIDGSGSGDGNNTVDISNFSFGAGSAGPGGPNLIGGASGDLTGVVTLTDTDFLNEFFQEFVPGTLLSFDVSMTTNVDGGPTPDSFSFAILDSTLVEIPTLDIASKFLFIDIDSNPGIETFASDPDTPPAAGGDPIDIAAPRVQTGVPEPGTWMLSLTGIALVGLMSVKRRLRSTHS